MPIVTSGADIDRISAATTVVGVIGDPVAHSLSPLLHNAAFAHLGLDWVSVGFPVTAEHIGAAVDGMRALGIVGLSVTMPHKEAASALVDRVTPVAATLGAVNCITAGPDGLVGSNTDGEGFVASLRRGDHFDPQGKTCLVVGAGGAARAVIVALADAGATEIIVVNRTEARAKAAVAVGGPVARVGRPEEAPGADLVVNATPAGMEGHQGSSIGGLPFDPHHLRAEQVVVDLVYHPASTPWLAAARVEGATVHNGLGMLVHQAAAQLRTWTGKEPPVSVMWQLASDALSGR